MDGAQERAGTGRAGSRSTLYCLLPRELAPKLHETLRRHFRDEPQVEVIVERRRADRRRRERRASAEGRPPGAEERRRVHDTAGRRIGERRATLTPVAAPGPLPRRARRYADQISFVERFEPSTQAAEDRDTARLVVRFQAGDGDAFGVLYRRYFDRVYSYLRTALRDTHEAEDGAQQVFLHIFEALPRYERRGRPFRAWLFVLVRNEAIGRLRKSGRLQLEEPAELERRRDAAAADEHEPEAINWLSDRDLTIFVERLPLPQRQVLLMRYVLDLSNKQIAQVLDRSAMDVGRLHYRAVTYLREGLASIGRGPRESGRRTESRRPITHVQVLRARRFALTWRS